IFRHGHAPKYPPTRSLIPAILPLARSNTGGGTSLGVIPSVGPALVQTRAGCATRNSAVGGPLGGPRRGAAGGGRGYPPTPCRARLQACAAVQAAIPASATSRS